MSSDPPGPERPGGARPPSDRSGWCAARRDWLPDDFAGLHELERTLLDQFRRAGYQPMRTPILEFSELHERKSGAGIVAKLFELPGGGHGRDLPSPRAHRQHRPGLRRGRAVPSPPLSREHVGPGLPVPDDPEPGRDREFTQIGVELLGAGGPAADAEVIWLADWSVRALGIADASIRMGHVGLILELLSRCGLPPAATSALVESLSEAAAEGQGVTRPRVGSRAAGRLAGNGR